MKRLISEREKKLCDALTAKAHQRLNSPKKVLNFTTDPEANRLVCDLDQFPHAFVIACMLDVQSTAEKVWSIPFELKKRLGTFDIKSLNEMPKERIVEVMCNPTNLHRYPTKMADAVYLAIQKIHEDYEGDASNIWSGRPTSAKLVRRFKEFKYVGPKIATMATNILVRYFGLELSDYESIDISADKHVVKVFKRLGFVGPNATKDDVIQKARKLSPEALSSRSTLP